MRVPQARHTAQTCRRSDSMINTAKQTGASEARLAAFVRVLYQEHLEEASFLYDHRLRSLRDPDLTWLDLEDFEERFETHLDALFVGGDPALALCREQALEGDAGEAYTAVRIFCLHNRLDLLRETLEALDPDEQRRVQAVGDALCHGVPDTWHKAIVTLCLRSDATQRQIAARVIGYRRQPAGADLLHVLPESSPDVAPTVMWSLGRLGQPEAVPSLKQTYLRHHDEALQAAAARALLHLGEPQAIAFCAAYAPGKPWTHLLLGLGGRRTDASILMDLAMSAQAGPDTLLALGLLGDADAVEPLMARLNDNALAEAAATALNLITGAECYEEVFVPEPLDEDELFEEERDRLARGVSLTPPGEPPPGKTVVRLCQDHDVWMVWWLEHKDRFRPGVRYRSGQPYAPALLLENLKAETTPHRIRRWTYEELVIRYGLGEPFEADLFVRQQRQTLARCAAWVEEHGRAFQEGTWYFAGALIN